MATQRSSFSKLQRDRDKQAKAAAKRDRRQSRDASVDEEAAGGAGPLADPQELLAAVEQAHREFDAGVIDFDTYEERKSALLSQLPVD